MSRIVQRCAVESDRCDAAHGFHKSCYWNTEMSHSQRPLNSPNRHGSLLQKQIQGKTYYKHHINQISLIKSNADERKWNKAVETAIGLPLEKSSTTQKCALKQRLKGQEPWGQQQTNPYNQWKWMADVNRAWTGVRLQQMAEKRGLWKLQKPASRNSQMIGEPFLRAHQWVM